MRKQTWVYKGTYPLENWMQRKSFWSKAKLRAVCRDVENPYIKYQHCQRWWFFSPFLSTPKKIFHIWSWRISVPCTCSPHQLIHSLHPPHTAFYFIVSNPNRSCEHWALNDYRPPAILNKAAKQCVYWVGEIKYCTITHIRALAKILDMLITHDIRLYWKWRNIFVCAFSSCSSRAPGDLISSFSHTLSHTQKTDEKRRGIWEI